MTPTSLSIFYLAIILVSSAAADSGGPYYFGVGRQYPIPDANETLTFYQTHEAEWIMDESGFEPKAIRWIPLRAGTKTETVDLGKLGDDEVIAIKFSADRSVDPLRDRLGILLLSREGDADAVCKPIFLTNGGSGTVSSYSTIAVRELAGQQIFTIIRRYSGSGGHKRRFDFTIKDGGIRSHQLFAGESKVGEELKKLGWEPWHRGHSFSEKTLSSTSSVYHNEKGHGRIVVEMEVRDGQLWEKSWRFLSEEELRK